MNYILDNTGKKIKVSTVNDIFEEINNFNEKQNLYLKLYKENDDCISIQTLNNYKDGHYHTLDYIENKKHLRATNRKISKDTITNIFVRFYQNDLAWKKDFKWEKVYFYNTNNFTFLIYIILEIVYITTLIFLLRHIKSEISFFIIGTLLFFDIIINKLLYNKLKIIKRRESIINFGFPTFLLKGCSTSFIFGLFFIKSSKYMLFSIFWFLFGIFIVSLFSIIFLISISVMLYKKHDTGFTFSTLNKKEIKREFNKNRFGLIIYTVLLAFWLISWTNIVFNF